MLNPFKTVVWPSQPQEAEVMYGMKIPVDIDKALVMASLQSLQVIA